MKTALIFWGGWDGHKPQTVAELLGAALENQGFEVTLTAELSSLEDADKLAKYDLIVPCWTMGQLSGSQTSSLVKAIRSGVGLGGIHGGMGDAFRGNTDYEWMVGGHFVGHPHVGEYVVSLTANESPITAGLPAAFPYKSEQYYMLTDPANVVLADTLYVYENRRCRMPVVWTKTWSQGRVFYSSLVHDPKEFLEFPHVLEMTVRGLLWAAR
ncbi:MAG: ThuA domain-containing protein [Verrucomicrobiota bacterium]|nr:ThuA domain-containing protein [Verrucomicrobiota bacterium]